MIDNTVHKLCVPLPGGKHWSVLDVVILLETGGVNGYVKETYYTKQQNNNVIVDSATNKVKSPHVMSKVFWVVCQREIGVSPFNIYFGSDDMTMGKKETYQLMDSSLEILKSDCDETKGIQEDSNIYGLWDLLNMFRRARGYQDIIGKLTLEDLQKKRVSLFCYVSRLFGILRTENK